MLHPKEVKEIQAILLLVKPQVLLNND